MKVAHIYINYPNIVVLQDYLDVVKAALEDLGYKVSYVKFLEGVSKKDLLVVPMGNDSFKFYFKGYHNLILWQQGATADESYMRHASKLRFAVLNYMDVFVMKRAKAILYVSDELRKIYEKRGHCSFEDKSYIMPCFNEEFDPSVYEKKDYSKKVFTYAGSLAVWQCFEQTVDLYKKIEDNIPNTFFKVLTFSVDDATRILEEKGIKKYSVACVPKERVKDELLSTTYGFILREDNVVNRVATPTKFSSYLSAGVIPVFSSCLIDFARLSDSMQYSIHIENQSDQNTERLLNFINKDIEKESIAAEYERVFATYYNKSLHKENLASLLKKLL